MTAPLIARARGIRDGQQTFTKDVYKKVIPAAVQYDTHPARVPGVSSGLFVITGETGAPDSPNGNIAIRQSGFWRFRGQIVFNPQETGAYPMSQYLNVYDMGPDANQMTPMIYGNNNAVAGAHPTIVADDVVRVDLGAASIRYFCFQARYVQGGSAPKATWALDPSQTYSAFTVEYVGPLA